MLGLNASASSDVMAHVLGVRFDCYTKRQAVERILYWVAEPSRRMVITAGPEFVMMTRQDAALRHIARVADMVTPDGIGVVWAARRSGQQVEGRVTGVELVEELLTTAVGRNQPLRVFLLGASQDSLDRCLTELRNRYPICTFEGRNGYFDSQELPGIMADIEMFDPDLWLVGLGQPKQERIIYEHLHGLPPCVAIGIGGSIDVWGGTVKRAPRVFQRMNAEWLYRLLKQPQRWRRQLALPRFVWHVLRKSE